MIIHTVQAGDTLDSIANLYNISRSRLETDNSLTPNYVPNIGQALIIAPPSQTYIVQEGDTIFSVADLYHISVLQLLRNNPQLSDKNTLTAGEELIISYPSDKTINVIGYSTVYITESVLRKTLPYLTYLFILNYRVDAFGSVADINDENIIRIAREYNVAPIMFISSMTETGRGSYATTHAILNNIEAQNQFIENTLIMLRNKGLAGINLAFYSILEEDLPIYVDFVSRITSRLNEEGYEVFVTLTPQTMGYQAGTSYDKPYYAELGRVSNYVILISYLWQQGIISQVSQTTYNFLKDILDFVTTQIPPEKIYISLARIAYDWELPYVEGETFGSALTNAGALHLANQLGSVIEFDEATQTPFYYYITSGVTHYVWFKDSRSITAILSLVDTYGLAGIAVWNILFYHTQTWLTINSQYNVNPYTSRNVDINLT